MKTKLLSIFMWAVLVCYAITCFAQSTSTSNNIEKIILSSYYKKDGKMKHINMDALRDFIKRFPLATSIKWEEAKGDFIATFFEKSNKTQAAYKKNGRWACTINRYDDEKMLPAEIRALIKRTYYDYTISHIDEIKFYQHENTIYMVLIQDDRNIKIVRVCDGELTLFKEFMKNN